VLLKKGGPHKRNENCGICTGLHSSIITGKRGREWTQYNVMSVCTPSALSKLQFLMQICSSVAVLVIGYESSHNVYHSYYTVQMWLTVCDHWTLHMPVYAKLWMLLQSFKSSRPVKKQMLVKWNCKHDWQVWMLCTNTLLCVQMHLILGTPLQLPFLINSLERWYHVMTCLWCNTYVLAKLSNLYGGFLFAYWVLIYQCDSFKTAVLHNS